MNVESSHYNDNVLVITSSFSSTPHIRSTRSGCICYFQKTGSPFHNFSAVKMFLKSYPPDFKFYLTKSINIFPYGVMLILSMFSLQLTV